jgi:DNA-binding winged helix-turn-helix (wHTH) protein/tetratricopeptide (TPR) repeat protein
VQVHPGTVYQFGPFEVNSSSGELLKNGMRVKLQEQPYRLLIALLESNGVVVSREDLRNRLWQNDTFVDFENGLRVAVRKLREALGDDADNPRYVETVPRRGYRFLAADVRKAKDLHSISNSNASSIPAEDTGVASLGLKTEVGPRIKEPRPKWSRALKVTLGITALLVIVTAAAFLSIFRHRKVLTGRDTVVLADFANSTGDPVFDDTLRQGLAVQLTQSPFLSLVSDQRIQQVLILMGKPAEMRLTSEIARDICERTASAAVLDGSIAKLGSRYVLGLDAKDCKSGEVLARQQAQVTSKEQVLDALSEISGKFRTQLGESLATVEKHNMPLAETTTPSLDALKAYSTGLSVASSAGDEAAVPFFQKAIEIDPQFAMAHAELGLMYGAIGESALSVVNTSKAYKLRDRTSDAEKFFITASFDSRVTGNFEKAQQTCEAWAQAYPRDARPHTYLSAFILPASARYERSIAEAQKTLVLDPHTAIGYIILAAGYTFLDRYGEAETTLRQGSDRGLETPETLGQRYDLAFLQGHAKEMGQQVALAQRNADTENWILDHQAFALAYGGHLREARMMSRQAADLAEQKTHTERAALSETGAAVWEAFSGNALAARKNAETALRLSNQREVQYGAAFALALAGDIARTQTLADDLQNRFPEDTSVRFSYLPTLRAVIALKRGHPEESIKLLQISAPYDLGTQRSTIHGLFGALYPIYVRGEAYLAAHQGAEAAAEFQKVLDHRGIVISDPVGALANLELGRAYVLSGDKRRADRAYQNFLAQWKDADSDIPVLKQAQAEYSKLKQ